MTNVERGITQQFTLTDQNGIKESDDEIVQRTRD